MHAEQPEILTDLTVSVVIPTCNRKERLLRLLKNLSNLNYPLHEIIIVDSGEDRVTIEDFKIDNKICIKYIISYKLINLKYIIQYSKFEKTYMKRIFPILRKLILLSRQTKCFTLKSIWINSIRLHTFERS